LGWELDSPYHLVHHYKLGLVEERHPSLEDGCRDSLVVGGIAVAVEGIAVVVEVAGILGTAAVEAAGILDIVAVDSGLG